MEKGGGKAGAGLAAIVCGRSFEKRTYCAEIVCFMYAKEKEGWIDLFAAVVYWRLCVLGFEKRRIPNGMLLLGGLLFLLIRFGLGMKMGYTAGWDGRLPGYGAALMMGIGETCGYLIRIGSLLIVLFPLYLVSHDRCGRHQNGSRPVWCRRAAAGRADFPVRAGSCRNMVARITYPAWDCQAAAYISCVLFVPVRAWGSVEPYYLEARDGKEASFVWHRACFGSDWGGADSVSVRKMACD